MTCIIMILNLVSSPILGPYPETKAEIITASWYALDGMTMANGDTFNSENPELAAHKKLPFGTQIHILNPQNGKELVVTITDRGPFIKGRSLDLSRAGAEILDFKEKGTAKLQMRVLNVPRP